MHGESESHGREHTISISINILKYGNNQTLEATGEKGQKIHTFKFILRVIQKIRPANTKKLIKIIFIRR